MKISIEEFEAWVERVALKHVVGEYGPLDEIKCGFLYQDFKDELWLNKKTLKKAWPIIEKLSAALELAECSCYASLSGVDENLYRAKGCPECSCPHTIALKEVREMVLGEKEVTDYIIVILFVGLIVGLFFDFGDE